MRRLSPLFLLTLAFLVSTASAQLNDTTLKREGWNYGVFAGYGNGVGDNSFVHRFAVGARMGRVMTGEYGPGFLRGTFEWGAEATPVEFLHYNETVYTAGITPVVLKWNFTNGNKKVVPFFEAISGVLFSSSKFPQGDTSRINFQSGAGMGFHAFTRAKRAVTVDVRAVHISNASIGNHNPGVNALVQVNVGYTWFK